MPIILKLRGATALSAFRLDKLNSQLAGVHRSVQVLGAEYWHFAELARALTGDELGILQRLLDYGEGNGGQSKIIPGGNEGQGNGSPSNLTLTPISPEGTVLLAVPRVGTISPWSSKATDIARRCGLDAVRRVERGVAYRLARGREISGPGPPVLPPPHRPLAEGGFL